MVSKASKRVPVYPRPKVSVTPRKLGVHGGTERLANDLQTQSALVYQKPKPAGPIVTRLEEGTTPVVSRGSLYDEHPVPEPLFPEGYRLTYTSEDALFKAEIFEPRPGQLFIESRYANETVRLPLAMEGGLLRGAAASANGQLAFTISAEGRLSFEFGGKDRLLFMDDGSRKELQQYTKPLRLHCWQKRVAELLNTEGLSPVARESLTLIAQFDEGPWGHDFSLLDKLLPDRQLSETELRQLPFEFLLSGAVGCDVKRWKTLPSFEQAPHVDALVHGLQTLASHRSGDVAGKVYEIMHRLSNVGQEDDEHLKLLSLSATAAAMYHALRAPSNDGEVDRAIAIRLGWHFAADIANNVGWSSSTLITTLSERCIRSIEQSVPSSDEARRFLQRVITQSEDDGRWKTRGALVLGALDGWQRRGRFPQDADTNLEGVPSLSDRCAFYSLKLRQASIGDFNINNVSWSQIAQGSSANCWVLHPLGAIAMSRPELIGQIFDPTPPADSSPKDAKICTVTVQLPDKEGVTGPIRVPVSGRLFAREADDSLLFAGDRAERTKLENNPNLWAALVEKALAEAFGRGYSALDWGTMVNGFRYLLAGSSVEEVPIGSEETSIVSLRNVLGWSWPATVASSSSVDSQTDPPLVASHAYILSGLKEVGGQVEVQLVNLHRGDQAGRGEISIPFERFAKNFDKLIFARLEDKKITPESLARAGVNAANELG